MLDFDFPDHRVVPTSSPVLRAATYEAFGGRCFWTGQEVGFDEMHIDHVVPQAEGGPDSPYNYVLSSVRANARRGSDFDPKGVVGPLYMIRSTYAPKVIALMAEAEENRERKRQGRKVNHSGGNPRKTVYIPDDVWDEAKRHSLRLSMQRGERLSMSEYVREAALEKIEREEAK